MTANSLTTVQAARALEAVGLTGAAAQVLAVVPLAGGVSNQTDLVTTRDGDFVVRRPPPGPRHGNAHDMAREHEMLVLASAATPLAPKPFGYESNDVVIGSPFLVMERKGGVPLARGLLEGMSPDDRGKLCVAFARLLATLHRAPVHASVTAVNPSGYVARQIEGWTRRAELLGVGDDVNPVLSWLRGEAACARSEEPRFLHNDFKFDNLLVDATDSTRPTALLDWELSTVGDPLMDLGCALAYWVQADDPAELRAIKRGNTDLNGMLRRHELVAEYVRSGGTDPGSRLAFYETFGRVRLALIAFQVARQKADDQFAEAGQVMLTAAEQVLAL